MRRRVSQAEEELGIHFPEPPELEKLNTTIGPRQPRPQPPMVQPLRPGISFKLALSGYWWCDSCGQVKEHELCDQHHTHRVTWMSGIAGAPSGREEGCRCRKCGQHYRVDLLLPDEVWRAINPQDLELLCGRCIVAALEAGGFGAWRLVRA